MNSLVKIESVSMHFLSELPSYHKGECRGLTQETCDISPVLTEALEALQDRPVLYK